MLVKFRAINATGAVVADSITVDEPGQVYSELTKRGLVPIEVQQSKEHNGPSLLKALRREQKPNPAKASKRQLAFFTAQMSILVETGTPVAAALQALQRQVKCPHWAALIRQLHQHVEEGGSLGSAVNLYPKLFDPFYVNMVAAGESSGNLNEILRRLADLSAQSGRIRAKVISALIYPALLTFIALAVLVVLIFFILPRFELMFAEMNVQLPTSTRAFLALSHFMRQQAILSILGCGAIVAALVFWMRSAAGRRLRQRVVLKLPIIGSLVSSLIVARVFRLLGLLVTSNVRLVEALELTQASTTHYQYEDLIGRMYDNVMQGRTMYEILNGSPLCSASVAEMVHTAEDNGRIGDVCTMLANYLDDRNETKVAALTSVLEPVILIFMGLVIGTVVLSLVLPMFDLSKIAQ